jgi:hypothetical protein
MTTRHLIFIAVVVLLALGAIRGWYELHEFHRSMTDVETVLAHFPSGSSIPEPTPITNPREYEQHMADFYKKAGL